MAPSNDSPEVQETELRSRAPPSEGASGKAREDTGSPNDHLTPSFTPLDEEDGEDHDDGDELVESEGGVDTPNGKIIWSTKLTWKLINAIKDDPIVRKEIFLPFGSGIARYKSLHYTRLANIVFGDSVTYGKRFKAYKEESRIKKNKFIQAVVNKLRKLRVASHTYTQQLGEIGKDVQCEKDITKLTKQEDIDAFKKIIAEFPWFFDLRDILASMPSAPPRQNVKGSGSAITSRSHEAMDVDPESESDLENGDNESESKISPSPAPDGMQDDSEETKSSLTSDKEVDAVSDQDSDAASSPASSTLSAFSATSRHSTPSESITARESAESTPEPIDAPAEEDSDDDESDNLIAKYCFQMQKIQMAEIELERVRLDAKVQLKLADLEYRGKKRKLEAKEKVQMKRLQVESELKAKELEIKRCEVELKLRGLDYQREVHRSEMLRLQQQARMGANP